MTVSRPLALHCWQGYDHPAVLRPFERRAGIEVRAEALIADHAAAAAVSGGQKAVDVLNINNAHTARRLWPEGRVRELSDHRLEAAVDDYLPQFQRLYRWARTPDQTSLLGVCQRFGAFNFVVNTRLVSAARARDEAFSLTADRDLPFGILNYDDFNVFHLCIASGIDPFQSLEENDFTAIERTARHWYSSATLVSDNHLELNRALVDKRIAFYLSGGVYTASPARLEGFWEVEAVTPERGPIAGKGGIVFTEVTSLIKRPDPHPQAEDFLAYLLEPDTATALAFVEGTCNPVAQMGNPGVMRAFTTEQLRAIQWDSLEEDVSRCADYDLMPDHSRILALMRSARSARACG